MDDQSHQQAQYELRRDGNDSEKDSLTQGSPEIRIEEQLDIVTRSDELASSGKLDVIIFQAKQKSLSERLKGSEENHDQGRQHQQSS